MPNSGRLCECGHTDIGHAHDYDGDSSCVVKDCPCLAFHEKKKVVKADTVEVVQLRPMCECGHNRLNHFGGGSAMGTPPCAVEGCGCKAFFAIYERPDPLNHTEENPCGECGHGVVMHDTFGGVCSMPNCQCKKWIAKKEAVNHPSHYGGADNPYEHIKVVRAWGLDYFTGNATKYIARAGKKDPSKEIEDLEKAIFYLQDKVNYLKSGGRSILEQVLGVPPGSLKDK